MEILQLQFEDEAFDPNELTDIPLWSAGEFVAALAPNPLPMFTFVEGDPVPGSVDPILGAPNPRTATRLDTNMLVPNQMNNDEGMKISSIGIEWFSVGVLSSTLTTDEGYETDRPWVSAPNLKRIFRDLVGSLKVATNVSQISLPASHFPTGWDVVVANGGARRRAPPPLAGVDTYVMGHAGIPEIRGQMIYQPTFDIAPTEVFRFDLEAPNQGVVTGLSRRHLARVHLHGRRRRPMT